MLFFLSAAAGLIDCPQRKIRFAKALKKIPLLRENLAIIPLKIAFSKKIGNSSSLGRRVVLKRILVQESRRWLAQKEGVEHVQRV